ncbi:adenylate kinase [Saprospiraceae bacterium]|nr:adenylate kinase [Saprospiraceae bacterium]
MKHLILFGPPGSGKGTQAKQLEQKYEMIHISTGDLFRYEIGNETPLGLKAKEYMNDGKLVPDAVTIGMLENKVNMHPEANGFIFDGFPRTIAQAEALDLFLDKREESINGLIALKVDDEEIVKRLLERGKTSGRPDDSNEEVIRNRIQVYNDQTSPVYDYYNEKKVSQKVEGIGSIEDIFDRLSVAIDQL